MPRRTGQFDPLLPFKFVPLDGRNAEEAAIPRPHRGRVNRPCAVAEFELGNAQRLTFARRVPLECCTHQLPALSPCPAQEPRRGDHRRRRRPVADSAHRAAPANLRPHMAELRRDRRRRKLARRTLPCSAGRACGRRAPATAHRPPRAGVAPATRQDLRSLRLRCRADDRQGSLPRPRRSWIERGQNILLFGPPGVANSHLGAALGHATMATACSSPARPISSRSCNPPARS